MVGTTHGSGACKRAGTRQLDTLYVIGTLPPGFDVAARGHYDDMDALFSESSDDTFRARLRAYADICMVSTHLSTHHSGSTAETQWEAALSFISES